jgi:dipeptidyl aminopeptidase/acylaminoacyl peptidase
MKQISIFLLASFLIILVSCDQGAKEGVRSTSQSIPSLDELARDGVFNPELMWRLGRISDPRVSPDGKEILFGITRYVLEDNKGQRDLFKVNLDDGEVIQLTETPYSEINALWKPDGSGIAYLSSESGTFQIWESDPDGRKPRQVSKIEGGINGFAFSPDMKHILYIQDVKLDPTPQEIHPDLPGSNVFIADDMMYRHWDQWHDYAYSHIFFAPYSNGDEVLAGTDIMQDERFDSPMMPWGGMEQISWSPDGKKIAYTCKKLGGKAYTLSTNSEIYLYDLESHQTTTLSGQGFDGYDWDPVFSPNGEKLAWRSMEEPGFEADKERIIIYDFATEQATDYSQGFDQSSNHFVWSADGMQLYFVSGTKATYQLYSLDVQNRLIRQITYGDHNYQTVHLAGEMLAGSKMSMSMPTELFLIDPKTGEETQLTKVNEDVFSRIKLGKVEKRWVKTSDDKEMLTWVIYPPDFDPGKKYPALLYCQGGPQSAVSQFFSYRWNFQMMAAHGYIVVAPNRRGLPTFGQEWNDQISGDYGGQNIRDYLSAIDALAAEPFVDENSLGAIGASYGGFSVFYLAGHHQKRFKAFISHCGMFNLEAQYASTEEYFFVNKDLEGPYWENPRPKSYDFSPHLYVDQWDTPIMIITGAKDYRIPYAQSLQAFNSAQLRGIPSRLLFFPDETHFVLKPQNAVLWQREFFKWLDEWLK